jgi:metallophosphoesterase (TIGR00282 family)
MIRILFIGDIMGRTGRRVATAWITKENVAATHDLVVANGENSAGGFGITERVAQELFELGIHVITGGNHTFDKREVLSFLNREPRLLRPANYPPGVPGHGVWTGTAGNGTRVAVLNLQGRVFMKGMDDPFRAVDTILEELESEVDVILVDFHAEATSEKVAFGWHLDGRVSGVVGTHTHVQTADERILPKGTAYITDVGMTGPLDSVIGVRTQDALDRFKLGILNRFQVARGDPCFCAVTIEVDESTGTAVGIRRHRVPLDPDEYPARTDEDEEGE